MYKLKIKKIVFEKKMISTVSEKEANDVICELFI